MHKMKLDYNKDTKTQIWSCTVCDRVVMISEDGYRALNKGDQEAPHYGGDLEISSEINSGDYRGVRRISTH